MVSLKPYLDSSEAQLVGALVDAYQRLLLATAGCNAELCAQSAGDLSARLHLIEESISTASRPGEVLSAQQGAEEALHAWRDRTQDYLRTKAGEMKDLMMLIAQTAETVAERDQSHNKKLKGLTESLKTIAELEDITRLRSSLIASVEVMTRTLEQMTRDTEQTRQALEQELAQYRSRLEETKQAALIDPLTGLANRRSIESDLALRVRRGQPFALLMLDINGFKQINDQYGHLAGDQLLRLFSSELKQVCRLTDLAGRWGGDEFIVLMSGGAAQAAMVKERIEQWVWGSYPLKVAKGAPSIKVEVRAAIGVALWQPGTAASELLRQADEAMYRAKRA